MRASRWRATIPTDPNLLVDFRFSVAFPWKTQCATDEFKIRAYEYAAAQAMWYQFQL